MERSNVPEVTTKLWLKQDLNPGKIALESVLDRYGVVSQLPWTAALLEKLKIVQSIN